MRIRFRFAVLGLALAALTVMPTASAAATEPAGADDPAGTQGIGQLCARRFDQAVQAYRDTFPARDLAGLGQLMHDEITVVLASGAVFQGRDAAVAALGPFFADPSWTQTFDEVTRTVHGCQTGFVLFDSVLTFPSAAQHTLIGLTFTLQHGQWLILHDQVTLLPN
ncbi:MAG: DUF4440 domain-containing protein [Micromonosporaceae bacterium]|nr:DUF4440 domain-containing protein [Micromonosporaceae bacterium]